MSLIRKTIGRSSKQRERNLLILVYLFLTLAFFYLWLSQGSRILLTAVPLLTIILSTGAAHIFLRRAAPSADPFLLPLVTCLSGLGLVMLQTLAINFLWKQLLWLLIGMGGMLLIATLPRNLRWLRRYRYSWLSLGLGLLGLTFVLGVNPLGRGARLWLGLAGIHFQPSEFLKIVFVIFLASYLAEKQDLIRLTYSQIGHFRIPSLPYLIPLLLVWTVTLLLLVAQQDLGAGTLFFGMFLTMLYVSSRQSYYVYGGLVLLVLAGIASYSISPFVALRINVWLDPWSRSEGGGYQIVQSLLSFAAGGLLGTGLGHGYGAKYIPVVHTDFMFAAVGEELGLSGALAVLIIYVFLLYRGLRIALLASSAFERLLVMGLIVGIVLQAWVIAAGNLKVLPLTGVTLPFVSYGGSSLIASYLAIGLLLYISAHSPGISSNYILSSSELLAARDQLASDRKSSNV